MTALHLDIQIATPEAWVPADSQLQAWAQAALGADQSPRELSLRVVERAEMAQLNQNYRGRPGPTNVLAFPFETPADLALALLGDLVICAPVVAEEARAQQKVLAHHWAHMLIHGTLHLLGHDHQDPEAARAMEALETCILQQLGMPPPYEDD